MYKVNNVQSQSGKSYSGNDFVRKPITSLSVSIASTNSLKILDAHVELRRWSPPGSPSTERALRSYVQHFTEDYKSTFRGYTYISKTLEQCILIKSLVWMCVCVGVCACLRACLWCACLRTCVRVCVHVYLGACLRECVRPCVCVLCVCACVCVCVSIAAWLFVKQALSKLNNQLGSAPWVGCLVSNFA